MTTESKKKDEDRHIRLILGDSFQVMAGLEEGSIGSIVTDPPYLIGFMSQDFDIQEGADIDPAKQQAWHEGWLKEAYRVLQPGGVIKAFSATRTMHRLAAAMRAVGFELLPGESLLAWLYGSGFPKSLNISKALEKIEGLDPEIVKEFSGRGTALKPAFEPFICGRKPLK